MGRVYAVASGKGGVGKTVTVANLGGALAAAGHDVAVVDTDFGMPNLGKALGVEGAEPTIHDVLAGDATVMEVLHERADGLEVVVGARELDAFARIDPTRLADIAQHFAAGRDYVLLDVGAGLSNDTVLPLEAANETMLVSTPGEDAVLDAERTGLMSKRVGTPVAGVVATLADADEARTIADDLDTELLAAVPDDRTVVEALRAGQSLSQYDPESPAAAAYRDLAAAVTGEEIPDPEAPAATADGAAGSTRPEPGSVAESETPIPDDPDGVTIHNESAAPTAEDETEATAAGPTALEAEPGQRTAGDATNGSGGVIDRVIRFVRSMR